MSHTQVTVIATIVLVLCIHAISTSGSQIQRKIYENVHSKLSSVILKPYNSSGETCNGNEQRQANVEACAGQPSWESVPYPGDCGKFLVCDCLYPTVTQCPSGLYFNNAPDMKVCDWPGNVNCSVSEGAVGSSTASTDTNTSEPPASPTTPITSGPCVGQAAGITIPYPENCQQYYFCGANGKTNLLSCPVNNWFSPTTGLCGPGNSPTACEAFTTTTEVVTETTQDPSDVCANQPVGQSMPVASNCQVYILCLGNGNSVTLNCPTGAYFNPATGNCGPGNSPTACQQ